jgi:hypothetical protein
MASNVTEITFRHEQRRAVAHGMIETAGQTFLLLIAVRVFAAGPTSKAFIAAGMFLGHCLAPMFVSWVTARKWPPSQGAAGLMAFSGWVFLVAAAIPMLPVFVVCSVLGMAAVSLTVPLLTQIYQDNYPEGERGARFSRTIMIRVAMAALFAEGAGRFLSDDMEIRYRWLLVLYAGAFGYMSYCLSQCPSQPLVQRGGTHPFRALRYVKEDRVFRWTLICWMFMGFANLMMWPMRVEYLANERYGLTLAAAQVALLTGVIPNVARLILSPVWGRLFDRVNFFVLRIVLNLSFAAGILTFFTSDTMPGLITGAIIFGISNAGADVAWTLWVTKFAPADRVADYMSVHTFFTGLRGLVAPLVAFHVVAKLSIGALGGLSAALIVLASLILVREIKLGSSPDPGTELLKDAGGDIK